MNIKTLKIGHRRFKVQEAPADSLDSGRNAGEIGFSTGKIIIIDDRPKDSQAEIIIHEVLHALVVDAGLEMSLEKEEIFVRALSPRLAAFMADNPTEIRTLLQMLK